MQEIKGIFFKIINQLMILTLLLLGPAILFAQDNPLILKGSFKSDQRLRSAKPYEWSWNENRLDMIMQKSFEDKAQFYANLWFRTFGFPEISGIQHLTNKDFTSPFSIDLREAYVDLKGFPLKMMDIRLGRQTFNWGSGDQLNPVNNLNPLDMEDIWDFGRYHGSDALKITYYVKDFSFEGIWIPFFRPATLPKGDWISAFMPEIELPEGMSLNHRYDTLVLPENTISKNSSYGLKASGRIKTFDLALYYSYIYDALPSPLKNVVKLITFTSLDLTTYENFFRQHNAGLSFSTSLFNIGCWGEFSVFMPQEEIIMSTYLYPSTTPLMDSLMLEKKPYFKYLAGIDYTFRTGTYFNLQYLHGFYHERGNENMNDYFTFQVFQKFFSDKLKIVPLSGAFIIADWEDISNNYALILNPEVTYAPNDNAELGIGYRYINGNGGSTFALVKDKDEFFVKFKYSF